MSKARIMIVEDEWTVADDIKVTLERLGYTTTSISPSGEEAIQNAEKDKPDLVLMDIVLEGKMDGIEVANEVRNRFNIPIVYLTAYADEKILERAKTTEPAGYIVKPFIEEDLKIAIEMALYKHKSEEERKTNSKTQ